MGWCVPHIGKVLSDFSDLDKEHPLNEKDLPGYDENILFFFKEDEQNGCFSQWYHSPFVVEGIRYATAEQYMMAKKALLFKDYEIYDRIMKEKSPRKCKALGKKVQGFDNKSGSIIFLVGLTMSHYRLLMPSASLDMNLRQCFRVMLQGYHPDGDELRNSLLSHSPSGSGIVALPENPVKARPLQVAGLCPSSSESKNCLPGCLCTASIE